MSRHNSHLSSSAHNLKLSELIFDTNNSLQKSDFLHHSGHIAVHFAVFDPNLFQVGLSQTFSIASMQFMIMSEISFLTRIAVVLKLWYNICYILFNMCVWTKINILSEFQSEPPQARGEYNSRHTHMLWWNWSPDGEFQFCWTVPHPGL